MQNSEIKNQNLLIVEAEREKLHVITNQWKSDLEFFKQDLVFLKRLIDNYFIWITKNENIDLVKGLGSELFQNLHKCDELLHKMASHSKELAAIVQGKSTIEWHLFMEAHELLENEMVTFVKENREIRKKSFKITEYVIDIENLSHLLPT